MINLVFYLFNATKIEFTFVKFDYLSNKDLNGATQKQIAISLIIFNINKIFIVY